MYTVGVSTRKAKRKTGRGSLEKVGKGRGGGLLLRVRMYLDVGGMMVEILV